MHQTGYSELVEAFSAARYEVTLDGETHSLCIGHGLPAAIRAWIQQDGSHAAAWIITGHNPNGTPAARAGNQARQAVLCQALRRPGIEVLTGRNRDPDSVWPDEPTCWVAGASESAMRQLGLRLGQAALVVIQPDGARLVWL